MSEVAKLTLPNGQVVDLPVVVGTESERALDVSTLRESTGYITLDPGYVNTGACKSRITFIDGDKGILHYRGIPIEVLAERSNFLETAYLLIHGVLPTKEQLNHYETEIKDNTMLHEDIRRFYDGFPHNAHPMAILGSVVCSLAAFYQQGAGRPEEFSHDHSIHLMGKLPTITAYAYKRSIGEPIVYPRNNLSYCANFLHMMFARPTEDYHINPDFENALNLLLILHADHEQNCSTSTVRMVRSSVSNMYACITAGICALWGPRHGGANQEVIEMLMQIHREGVKPETFIENAKKKEGGSRLYGFGHRVYKNFDPRAKIIKKACDRVLSKLMVKDPLLQIAQELEALALEDTYFVERKLYPNVDFYSGILYRAMGIPVDAFPVMFALGRLPGWIAHAKEYSDDPKGKIGRPRQVYTGPVGVEYQPLEKRG